MKKELSMETKIKNMDIYKNAREIEFIHDCVFDQITGVTPAKLKSWYNLQRKYIEAMRKKI